MNDNTELIGCVSHDCATCKKQADALEALQAELAQAKFSYMDGYEGGKQEARDAAHEEVKGLTAERNAALARLAEIEGQEPACWGMPHADGRIYDVICSEEHAEIEGRYTVPLFAAGASAQPVQPSRDHRGEIIDVLCDDVFGETYESPQTGITDEQGRAMTYWGGNAIRPPIAQPEQQTIDAKDAEIARLREVLEGIHRYGLDTLSGRTDGADDRNWQRAGVNEMTKRARLGLKEKS